jgi:Holliday junction resolvasome RuvABC endonuclease subunit
MKYILGIDPGPTSSGIAIVKYDKTPIIVSVGEIPSDNYKKFDLELFDVVTIEKPVARNTPLGKETCKTIWYAGLYHGYFESAEIEVHSFNVSDIRQLLCGRPNAKDAEVAESLSSKFDFSWGHVKKNERKLNHLNTHEYNALATIEYYLRIAA